MDEKKVIILVGIPVSGKSTYIKQYIEKNNPSSYSICSADHYFERSGKYLFNPKELPLAHDSCWKKFIDSILSNISIIFIDNTNIIKEHRNKYINKALDSGYKVEIKVFPPNVEVSKQRNVHNVPPQAIEKMASQLDISPGTYSAIPKNNTYELKQQLENLDFIRSV